MSPALLVRSRTSYVALSFWPPLYKMHAQNLHAVWYSATASSASFKSSLPYSFPRIEPWQDKGRS